jgi:hypothetical protein
VRLTCRDCRSIAIWPTIGANSRRDRDMMNLRRRISRHPVLWAKKVVSRYKIDNYLWSAKPALVSERHPRLVERGHHAWVALRLSGRG